MNVKEKLQALLTASNTTTGETDTTLTDAVQRLVDGYGSGELPEGIAEIAYGTYTPTEKGAGETPIPNPRALMVEHGMNGTPDGYIVIPSVWYDTQDSQVISVSYFRFLSKSCFGRRSVSSGTTWGGNDILTTFQDGGASKYANETYVNFVGGSFAQFCPTWVDGNGNTGTQIYKWIAWRWAE